MSDSEETDLMLEDRSAKEIESLKFERDLLDFIFHFKEYEVSEVKDYLAERGITVRIE